MTTPEQRAEWKGLEVPLAHLARHEEARGLYDSSQVLDDASNALPALISHIEALEAENARLKEVARDAMKALPVLRTLLESAGLAAGVIVAEGMIAHTRAAMGESE